MHLITAINFVELATLSVFELILKQESNDKLNMSNEIQENT